MMMCMVCVGRNHLILMVKVQTVMTHLLLFRLPRYVAVLIICQMLFCMASPSSIYALKDSRKFSLVKIFLYGSAINQDVTLSLGCNAKTGTF